MGRVQRYYHLALNWLSVRPARFALVVWIFAFGVYSASATVQLQGYDNETAASAEGFVRTGDFKLLSDSVYVAPGATGQGIPGKQGKRVGRAGLPQPLLMVPFYLVGRGLDQLDSGGRSPRFRQLSILFYNPAVTAITAALVCLILLRLRSWRWAVAVAVLFTLSSIAWPYSKIGMDNTVMLGVALTVAGAIYAWSGGSAWSWAVTGLGAGMTAAAKPYEAAVAIVVMALLGRSLLAAPARRRRVLVLALVTPIVLWAIGLGWYDWLREGSIFKTGGAAYNDFTLSTPLNAIGFFLSPGKGLLFYSPLIGLGILGLVGLWRQDRRLAVWLIAAVVIGTLVVSVNNFWSDETWGPRYLVPIAWLLLLPIPWWATNRRRRGVLIGLAVVATLVQLVAMLAPYRATVVTLPFLTGSPIYRVTVFGYTATPFGNDVIRWIPQLSPLLVQAALVLSWVALKFGLGPITYAYHPFLGISHQLTMNQAVVSAAGIPDLWWRRQAAVGAAGLAASLVVAAGAAVLLSGAVRGRARSGAGAVQPLTRDNPARS